MTRRLGRARVIPEAPAGAIGVGQVVAAPVAIVTMQRPWLTEDELAAWFGNSPGTWANLRTGQRGPQFHDIPGVGIVYRIDDVMRWADQFKRSSTMKTAEELRAADRRGFEDPR